MSCFVNILESSPATHVIDEDGLVSLPSSNCIMKKLLGGKPHLLTVKMLQCLQ